MANSRLTLDSPLPPNPGCQAAGRIKVLTPRDPCWYLGGRSVQERPSEDFLLEFNTRLKPSRTAWCRNIGFLLMSMGMNERRDRLGEPQKSESGEFLLKKAVFLLTSSVGMSMAETLIRNAVKQIGLTPEQVIKSDIKPIASVLERNLSEFVGNEKAAKLASALRVLVGGISGA